jgi:hypothetical protein
VSARSSEPPAPALSEGSSALMSLSAPEARGALEHERGQGAMSLEKPAGRVCNSFATRRRLWRLPERRVGHPLWVAIGTPQKSSRP